MKQNVLVSLIKISFVKHSREKDLYMEIAPDDMTMSVITLLVESLYSLKLYLASWKDVILLRLLDLFLIYQGSY